MNLEDLVDENGLQQDDYSLSGVVFGEEGQLKVVGRSGEIWSAKYYILKCNKCSQDSELFGDGYFKSLKGSLVRGSVPCGCSYTAKWSQEQYFVLCSRKATEIGYVFLGFVGEWKGQTTKIKMSCEKHGEWSSGNVNNLIHSGDGCPRCGVDAISEARKKPDDVMIVSFHKSKAFHPDTKFWRSERLDSRGWASYWHVFCPECGESGESNSSHLQRGQRPCACNVHRQQECYINWVVDEHNNAVAIKFGIARDSKRRVKQQDTRSAYEVRQHQVYTFPSVASCKKAERECKKELDCGIVLKRDMPDGWTETTSVLNLSKVVAIYKRNGGMLNE